MINIFKAYKLITAVILLAFTAYACEKEIDVDLRSVPSRILIEGMVRQNSAPMVRVSRTLDFNESSDYPFLKGAVVKISDDAGNTETLKQDNTGWYVAGKLRGETGRTYNLSVNYEGKEYTATSKMPPQVKIDSLTMYRVPIMDYALPMVHFKDPVGKENDYYRCIVYINGKQRMNAREIVLTGQFTDGSPMHAILPVSSENDEDDPVKQGDELLVEFQSVDKKTYTFFENLSRLDNSLTNPASNIKGGALGVFSAFSYDLMLIVAK
ncbi:MAG: DUF4249 domain-containing protein [Prevotella sp.]|jgi:hypothetical protein|nr:DUF4249 domain-containing protein [Prevotella sp.]